jgi:hypothetical protein
MYSILWYGTVFKVNMIHDKIKPNLHRKKNMIEDNQMGE